MIQTYSVSRFPSLSNSLQELAHALLVFFNTNVFLQGLTPSLLFFLANTSLISVADTLRVLTPSPPSSPFRPRVSGIYTAERVPTQGGAGHEAKPSSEQEPSPTATPCFLPFASPSAHPARTFPLPPAPPLPRSPTLPPTTYLWSGVTSETTANFIFIPLPVSVFPCFFLLSYVYSDAGSLHALLICYIAACCSVLHRHILRHPTLIFFSLWNCRVQESKL